MKSAKESVQPAFTTSESRFVISHHDSVSFSGAGLVQRRDSSPSNNVARVRIRPSAICELSLFLVPVLLRVSFSGLYGFPPSAKTNISKFQFNQDRGTT